MWPVVLLVLYCLLILLASLAGGWIPLLIRLTHRRMECAVSLVAGVMLGVGLLHMLPHALLEAPEAQDAVLAWVLVGFLAMFFLERFFCYHHHHVPDQTHGEEDDQQPGDRAVALWHEPAEAHRLTWSGAALGLTLHTVIAGFALAASVEADARGAMPLAGLGTFLVIFLHKPFDAMTIGTLMAMGGWSAAVRHAVNGLFALMIPVGVGLFHLGLGFSPQEGHAVAYALAFSAGTFLCVAMSDLLPELHFHRHDRVVLSVALLLGLSVAWGVGVIEVWTSGHAHGHAQPAPAEASGPGAHSHDHDVTPASAQQGAGEQP